jgi:hypothetical protein
MNVRRMMPLCLVGLLHFTIVAHAFRNAGDLISLPIRNDDSAMHFYTATHAAAHWRATGSTVGFDPGWMAGYPEGPIGLVDNKYFELIVALAPRGWEAAVYNGAFLLALLSPPWILYGAARAGGASAASATGAAFCAVLATFTVPIVVHFIVWGGISYVFASVLVVPTTIVLGRALAANRLWRPCALSLGLTLLTVLVHPAVIPVILTGFIPAVAAAWHRRPWVIVYVLGISAVLAASLFPVLRIWSELRGTLFLADPQGRFLHGGIVQFIQDWCLFLMKVDLRPRGAGGLLGLLALALIGVWSGPGSSISRSVEQRLTRRVVLAASGGCAALAYVAATVVPRVANLQPYRYVVPLAFLLCLPAGETLAAHVAELRTGRGRSWLIGLAAVAVAMHAGFALMPIFVFGVGWDPAEEALVQYVQRIGDGGRWVVESRFEPEPASRGAAEEVSVKRFALMPLRTNAEFLGYSGTGPISKQRYTVFRHGLLFGRGIPDLDEQVLRRYAVTHVVGCAGPTVRDLRRLETILEQEAPIGECWAFRVRRPDASRVLEGRGDVRAGLDRIEVRGAEGDRIVLKYHWLPTLRTEPPLPIEEVPQPGAPVGFIGIRPGGQRDFDIVDGRLQSPRDYIVNMLHPFTAGHVSNQ